MKYALVLVQLAFGFGLLPCAVMPAYPHGGGLDAYGCHHNRNGGGYHCLTSLCRRVQFCEVKDFSQAAPFRDNLTHNRKGTKADERGFKSTSG